MKQLEQLTLVLAVGVPGILFGAGLVWVWKHNRKKPPKPPRLMEF